MNYLIVCNTPYQVFNAINILGNNIEMDCSECDVLIDETFHAFKDSKRLGANILKNGLCRNVYYAKMKDINKRRSKIESFFYLIKRNHLQEFTFSDNQVMKTVYDAIWVGDGNSLGCSLLEINKTAEVVWYDDGLLSYSISPRNAGYSKLHEAVMKCFRMGAYKYHPGKLYVNYSAFAMTKDFSVQQLPMMNENNAVRESIGEIFDYMEEASFLKQYRFFALIDGQITSGAIGYNGTDMEKVLEQTCLAKSDVIIRKHPRDQRAYNNYNVDEGANMWELECIKNLNNLHVLMASCSTAQLAPKLICQKEPYLIFLYKLFLDEDSLLIKENTEIVNRIRNMYSDGNKIFVPDNIEELNHYLLMLRDD